MRKTNHNKKMKASLTVEAAVLIPLALLTITGGIKIGYNLFHEAKSNAVVHEELMELDPVEIVRNNTLLEKLK
ncbi:hypothetical protein C823_005705 [Eubacterium plexicaudatum ASF492]|uniref:Uncharacterized protein n=1 Tax=Eubacterium plexicaudatum ASF492 TaxID=1235802 RepID=N2B8G7_9FIRM|nr:hypothetical protein C823_005705 [Eubacterium plexicaudatum ASF492]